MAIRVIVDSAADYSAAEIERRGIGCAPMTISFGDEVYKDGVDITKDIFFEKLLNNAELPKTSQPSPGEFADLFEEVKEAGDSAIVILVSGALSGTVQSAHLAKDMVEYEDIHIIDSKSATLGIRLLADTAVHLKNQGESVEKIVNTLEELKSKIRIFAGLDTLEYLYKGGRLSKTQASLGKLANVKPIVTVDEAGTVVLASKQLGIRHAYKQIRKMLEENPINEEYPVYFLYSYDKNNCAGFVKSLQKKGMDFGEIKTRGIGPTIGTHIGPGAFGIVYIGK